ncbi:hypothetical protein GALL_239960 [mine drainage metagenome]|uniref:Uncharacterized protein n=1 Tax=mine drainage metagenome TaxID=410659 RepID=A0A1J5RX85_9ZZZZ
MGDIGLCDRHLPLATQNQEDLLARVFDQRLKGELGQSLMVERPVDAPIPGEGKFPQVLPYSIHKVVRY